MRTHFPEKVRATNLHNIQSSVWGGVHPPCDLRPRCLRIYLNIKCMIFLLQNSPLALPYCSDRKSVNYSVQIRFVTLMYV